MAPPSDKCVNATSSTPFRDTGSGETPKGTEKLETEAGKPAFSATTFRSLQRPDSFTERPGQDVGEDQGSSDASLGSDLKQTAQTATDTLRRQAAQIAQDVGHELSKTGEDQKKRGADAIRHVARAIDSAAAELESQSPMVARTVHETARQVEGLSDNLSGRSVNELIGSAAQLARSQPALFIGGSVVAGFALARFLRSSSAERSEARQNPNQS
jgi:hypothetical protein